MIGVCALCHSEDDLKGSHLLPKALYRFMRIEGPRKVSPVLINTTTAWNSDKQIRRHLLCGQCEQRFAVREDWTLRHMYRGQQSFKLFDILSTSTPFAVLPAGHVVFEAATIPQIDVSKLSYFAISVFWRAGVTSWSFGEETTRINLGPRYEEAMRMYLLGSSPFPENVVLQVQVANRRDGCVRGMFLPKEGEKQFGHHRYRLFIPGIAFYLFVGQKVPVANRDVCFATSPKHIITLFNYEDELERIVFKAFKTLTNRTKPIFPNLTQND